MSGTAASFSSVAQAQARWDRAAVLDWQAQRSPDTRELERYFVGLVTARARHSRPALAALRWAQSHGVEIMMAERGEEGSGYIQGTGTVFLGFDGDDGLAIDEAVGSLTHEIRHAYHDINGLLAGDRFLRLGLAGVLHRHAVCEADAHAHGYLAVCALGEQDSLTPPRARARLREGFLNWEKRGLVLYGDQIVGSVAKTLGLRRDQPRAVQDIMRALRGGRPVPPLQESSPPILPFSPRPGLESTSCEYKRWLGISFASGNYLTEGAGFHLPPFAVSPTACMQAYLSRCVEDKPVVAEIEHRARIWRRAYQPLRPPLP